MKPYDKSNSFIHRVTKRVSELIPGTTWMNSFLSESQSNDVSMSTSENNDQPPVKKLCTSNNTFTNNSNYHSSVDTKPSINSTNDPRNFHMNVILPEISAVTCMPSTSRQSPKFSSQSNSSLHGYDVGNKSSLKRKSEAGDLININQQIPKAFNFASSTPTLGTTNKPPGANNSLKRSLNSEKFSSNEFSTPTSTNKIKTRETESPSLFKFRETSKPKSSSASFRWDTFVNYGELSERQKLFAHKSPLNCSHVMYGGSSARSTLSKILGNTPPIHKKTVVPISPTNNSEIRTTSSILLDHISKDKEIEDNKFIIQPKVHQRHKADQKSVPLKVETTIKHDETAQEKTNDKSMDVPSIYSGRDSSRKLRANISKKACGIRSNDLEMPPKVDLPNISLTVPVLPNIKLSDSNVEDNEFVFNQPLTIEQFSIQIAEKTSRKKLKINLKKTQSTYTDSTNNDHSKSLTQSSSCDVSTFNPIKNETGKDFIFKVQTLDKIDKVSESCKFDKNSKDTLTKTINNSDTILESKKVVNDSSQLSVFKNNNTSLPEKPSVELKKWTCDTCWVSNDSDKINCVACQTPKPGSSQLPLKVSKPSTWTCGNCWVPNKNEIDACVACQSQKPGTTRKVIEQSSGQSNWTCDACWVKNKSECISCISCGTVKVGCTADNKPQPSTQFKFGLNNNDSEKSGGNQFKFGFDDGKTGQSSSQFTFGSTDLSPENRKSESSIPEFKFGVTNNKTDQAISTFKFGGTNNKTDQSLSTFKFGSDSVISQPLTVKGLEVKNNTDQSDGQFKFGLDKNLDQPENEFKFGLSSTSTSKPLAQFKFGLNNVKESDKSSQQSLISGSKVVPSTNELKSVVGKNDSTELQSKSIKLKLSDTKQVENSTPQVTFGSIETNCNSNALVNLGHKNEDKAKVLWDKKDSIETKPISFGMSQTLQSTIGNSNSSQMVNGHTHSNEISNTDHKPGLIKTSQLFSFGSMGKHDQPLTDGQKNPTTFTFGSATTDKAFVTPISVNSSFSSSSLVFGASKSIFSSGPTTSIPVTLGSSVPAPQFSFGSIAPSSSNSFFSKPVNETDNKLLPPISNSFTATTNIGFSFGSQSSPVFNSGGLIKSSILADDPTKSTSNMFNQSQSNTKEAVKLDPNAPISINFTGGATTQFTAKPETTEPPPKRKILKPVRRIR